MSGQTSYPTSAPAGRAGNKSCTTDFELIEGAVADGAVKVGCMAMLSDGKAPNTLDQTQVKALAALTVSATAILATGASAASAQTITGASLDGASGNGAKLSPARRITLVLSSHANWDLTTAFISGEDCDGNPIKEALVIPDAGNATLTTKQYFGRVTEIYIPAQSGTAGTFTAGVTADEGMYRSQEMGIVLRDTTCEPLTSDSIADKASFNWMKKGRVYVLPAATVAKGDPVYVRTAAGGNGLGCDFTNTPTSGYSPVKGASFASDGSTTVVAELELR